MSRTKSLWSVLLIGLLFSTCIQSQEVDGISRNSLIDDNWKFQLSDFKEAVNPGFDDTGWTTLSLPHDWSIQGSFDIDAPAGNDGGYLPTGIGWYRKSLEIPSSYQGKRFSLYFEGVYMNAEVYVNGQKAGFHPYGYTSFSVDITPYVQLGKDNVVAVRVDNSQQKNCRWYSGSGIYRHVRLQVYDPVHVAHWGVAVTTPQVTEQQALVAVNTEIRNETSQPQTRIVKVTIRDARGKKMAEKEMPISLSANEKKAISHELLVDTPELWDIDRPYLYKAEITVLENGRAKDIVYQPFGIRTVEYSAQGGLTLNGKPIKLNGGCVHHDNGCLGAAAYDRAEERRVQLLKASMLSAPRTTLHRKPFSTLVTAWDYWLSTKHLTVGKHQRTPTTIQYCSMIIGKKTSLR
jgi:beta-galactosidase